MRWTLLYDADCGFCAWTADRILTLDTRGRLRAVALHDPEAATLLPRLREDARMASFHLVGPDGRARSAADAVPETLRLLPGGRLPAAVATALPRATERGYRWLARHRGTLGRVLARRDCTLERR